MNEPEVSYRLGQPQFSLGVFLLIEVLGKAKYYQWIPRSTEKLP